MAASKMLYLVVLFLVALDPPTVAGMKWQDGWTSLVSGNVFCDQCMKNAVFPFALPVHGATVSVQCTGADGKMVASADATTDFFGGFLALFKGVADLEGCRVYTKSSPDSSCSIVGDQGGRALQLKAKLFFSAFYGVEPMFFKPPAPKLLCPGAPKPDPHPQPPPFNIPPLPPMPPKPPAHGIPPLPPITIPPNPWKDPSTCSADEWMKSEFFCHWRKVTPFQTTVGMMFGKAANRKYRNMTLYQALHGQDDLLKQAVAAVMNSYINPKFSMSRRGVKKEFLLALKGPQQLKWDTAWKLKQANAGWGKGKCYLTPCKS